MPNNVLIKYGSKTTLTCAVASLASDTNLLAGIESSVIDNTTDGYTDIIVSGKVTTGTSPTASRSIEVWVIGWDGANWPDVFDGTTSSETITSSDVKNAICKPVCIQHGLITQEQQQQLSGLANKVLRWVDVEGIGEVGIGYVINARKAIAGGV